MNTYTFEYKTIATTPWKRKNLIAAEHLDGWNYVREEKVTARKVAVVFWKKIPNGKL